MSFHSVLLKLLVHQCMCPRKVCVSRCCWAFKLCGPVTKQLFSADAELHREHSMLLSFPQIYLITCVSVSGVGHRRQLMPLCIVASTRLHIRSALSKGNTWHMHVWFHPAVSVDSCWQLKRKQQKQRGTFFQVTQLHLVWKQWFKNWLENVTNWSQAGALQIDHSVGFL